MRLRNKIDKILYVFLAIIMAILVLDVLWQVASRYLFNSPSSFTDELAGFLLIWVGLLGAAYGTGTRSIWQSTCFHQNLISEKENISRL